MRATLHFTHACFARRTILYTDSKLYDAEHGLNRAEVIKRKMRKARQ